MQINDTDLVSDTNDDQYILSLVEEFVDLLTSCHIRNDPYKDTYSESDHLAPWQWVSAYGSVDQTPEQLYDWYFQGGSVYGESPTVASASMPPHYINVDKSRGVISFNYDLGAEKTWYLEKGPAWLEQRGQFEGVIELFNEVVSYRPTGFETALFDLGQMRKALIPLSGDIEPGDVEAASQINIASDSEDVDEQTAAVFTVTDEWSEYAAAASNLGPFQGRAVEVFTASYLDRLPAILLGQAMTARVLEDTLVVAGEAFKGVRIESLDLLCKGIDYLHSLDAGIDCDISIDWSKVMAVVSGVASIIAGATAFTPATQIVSAISGMISGAASVASAVIESPKHQELVELKLHFEAGSPQKFYKKFCMMIDSYLQQVDNTEQVLSTNLTDYLAVMKDVRDAITIYTSYGDDITLNQREAFFEVKRPAIASIDLSDGYSAISDTDMMGPAPKTGIQFGGDLNALFKASRIYIPGLADHYRDIMGFDIESGVSDGFTRTSTGYNPAAGNYENASTGPVFGAWSAVADELREVLKVSASNLDLAGEGLTAAAIMYALQDEAAASQLDDVHKSLVDNAL